MLGRLIKHEWKEIYKIGLLMLALICGMTIIGMLGFRSTVWKYYIMNDEVHMNSLAAFTGIMSGIGGLFIYIFSLVGVTYGIMIYIGIHFYRTMYTDRGYLTQTLPVKPIQLLVSKLLVGGVWVLFVEVAIGISMVILIYGVCSAVVPETVFRMNMEEFFTELYWVYKQETGVDLLVYAVTMLFLFLIGPFMSISILFGAVTLGQLSRKHRGMMGIIAYFVLLFINSLFGMIINILLTVGNALINATEGYMNMPNVSGLISATVIGVAMFFVAHYILENKLNMD